MKYEASGFARNYFPNLKRFVIPVHFQGSGILMLPSIRACFDVPDVEVICNNGQALQTIHFLHTKTRPQSAGYQREVSTTAKDIRKSGSALVGILIQEVVITMSVFQVSKIENRGTSKATVTMTGE